MKLKIYCCLIFLLFIQFLWSVFSTYYYCYEELVHVVKNGDESLLWDPDIAKWRNSPELIYGGYLEFDPINQPLQYVLNDIGGGATANDIISVMEYSVNEWKNLLDNIYSFNGIIDQYIPDVFYRDIPICFIRDPFIWASFEGEEHSGITSITSEYINGENNLNIGVDIYLNATLSFLQTRTWDLSITQSEADNASNDAVFLYNILLHEIGHSVGLGHILEYPLSSSINNIMNSTHESGPNGWINGFTDFDILIANRIYGLFYQPNVGSIVNPQYHEYIQSNTTYTINCIVDDIPYVDLYYFFVSQEEEWIEIQKNCPYNQFDEYLWQVPYVELEECRVAVLDSCNPDNIYNVSAEFYVGQAPPSVEYEVYPGSIFSLSEGEIRNFTIANTGSIEFDWCIESYPSWISDFSTTGSNLEPTELMFVEFEVAENTSEEIREGQIQIQLILDEPVYTDISCVQMGIDQGNRFTNPILGGYIEFYPDYNLYYINGSLDTYIGFYDGVETSPRNSRGVWEIDFSQINNENNNCQILACNFRFYTRFAGNYNSTTQFYVYKSPDNIYCRDDLNNNNTENLQAMYLNVDEVITLSYPVSYYEPDGGYYYEFSSEYITEYIASNVEDGVVLLGLQNINESDDLKLTGFATNPNESSPKISYFDIDYFLRPLIKGNVEMSDGTSPSGIAVEITNLNNNEVNTVYTDSMGNFEYKIDYDKLGPYNIRIMKNGYYPSCYNNLIVETENEIYNIGEHVLYLINTEMIIVSENDFGFKNISEAINYSWENGGGTIIVKPGIYSGIDNVHLHWTPYNFNLGTQGEEVHINIYGIDKETCIIDASDYDYSFLFDDGGLTGMGYGQGYTNNDVIENLTICNSNQGIIIENGSPTIRNCIIQNCETDAYNTYSDIYGVGIECNSSATIEGNLIQDNSGNWMTHYTYGGGISIINNTDSPALVINNIISGCAAAYAGGIYCNGTGIINIENNIIVANMLLENEGTSTEFCNGFGIYSQDCQNLNIRQNVFFNHCNLNHSREVILADCCDNLNIINNSIIHNQNMVGLKLNRNTNCSIVNNILMNNLRGIDKLNGEPTEITYSVGYNNTNGNYFNISEGEGCFSEDPRIDPNTHQPIWDSDEISPCIDSGDPSIFDEDGTPSDIGAIPATGHDYKLTALNFDRIRWISLPVLDRFNVNEGMETDYVFNLLKHIYPIIINGKHDHSYWDGSDWNPLGIVELQSITGYKVEISEDADLPVIGFKQSDTTVIQLDANVENWIGYFVEETLSLEDAFVDIWDNLKCVASEDWFWEKNGTYPSGKCNLIYGKLYIIKVFEACEFQFGEEGTPENPKERTMTEGFFYEETLDYTPIVIESLNDPTIEEVGIFLDEECIGATQINDFPVQILAFVPEEEREEQMFTFRFFTGDRQYKKCKKYLIYDEILDQFVEKKLTLAPYEMVTISFEMDLIPMYPFNLYENYPNPFNPTTTIQFSIPEYCSVELSVYNIKGQKVVTLIKNELDKGLHEVIWDGLNMNNKQLPSGIYMYKLKAGNDTSYRKMLLLK